MFLVFLVTSCSWFFVLPFVRLSWCILHTINAIKWNLAFYKGLSVVCCWTWPSLHSSLSDLSSVSWQLSSLLWRRRPSGRLSKSTWCWRAIRVQFHRRRLPAECWQDLSETLNMSKTQLGWLYRQSMTVCWSRDHRHVTTSQMKFAVRTRNVIFLLSGLCNLSAWSPVCASVITSHRYSSILAVNPSADHMSDRRIRLPVADYSSASAYLSECCHLLSDVGHRQLRPNDTRIMWCSSPERQRAWMSKIKKWWVRPVWAWTLWGVTVWHHWALKG